MRKRYRAALLAILFLCAAQLHAQLPSSPAPWSDRSLHQVRFVTVAPDIQLEVVDWGGAGAPLVLLAGTSFNAHAFDDLAPRFTNRHRVIGITRRGHGASSWPDSGYTLSTLVQDIRTVLDALDVQRAILAGHSFAGNEMTRFAAEHPDRLAGLIYIDAAHDHTMTPGFGKVCPPFDAAMMEAFNKTFKNPDLVTGTQLRTGPDGVPRPFVSPSALEQMKAGLPSPDYAGVGVPALGIFYVPQRIEEMAPGTRPSPACQSSLQRYVYGGIAAFANGVQRATVVALQNSQHNLHLASPDEVAAEMQRWLAGLPSE